MSIKSKSMYLLLAGILLLQACTFGQTPMPTPTLPSTQTPVPPMPTQPTVTPTPRATIQLPSCVPSDVNPSELESPLVKISQWGKGGLKEAIYSPDGNLIAVRSGVAVDFYNAQSFEQVNSIAAESQPWSMAFSPDGKLFVLVMRAYSHGIVRLYSADTGNEICTLTFDGEAGEAVFSPDSSTLAISSMGIHLWDVTTGKTIRTISDYSSSTIAFSSDGKYLAGSGEPGTLKIWNVETGKELKTLGKPQRGTDIPIPVELKFSNDGTSLFAEYMPDPEMYIWNIETGERKHLPSHTIAVSADNTKGAYYLSESSSVVVYDMQDFQAIRRTTLIGNQGAYVRNASFSPDGTRLIVTGDNNAVKVFGVDIGRILHTFSSYYDEIESIALSPDGKTLAVGAGGSYNTWIKLLNAKTGEEIRKLSGHEDIIFDLDFSPDGTKLASASRDGSVKIWDVNTGQEIYTSENEGWMADVDFSPDGLLLAMTDLPALLVVDTLLGAEVTFTTADPFITECVGFSPDGKTIAWGGGSFDESGVVKLFDATTGQEMLSLDGHTNIVSTIAFSPGGNFIASGSWDHTVKIWDAATGAVVFTFDGNSAYIDAVSFSPNGKLLAAALLNGTIKVWDIGTGKELATLTEHSDAVSDLLFSPDGTLLYSSSWDGTVIVWGVQ